MEARKFTLPVAGLPWPDAQVLFEALLAAAALGIAAALRPWRCVGDQGRPGGGARSGRQ